MLVSAFTPPLFFLPSPILQQVCLSKNLHRSRFLADVAAVYSTATGDGLDARLRTQTCISLFFKRRACNAASCLKHRNTSREPV